MCVSVCVCVCMCVCMYVCVYVYVVVACSFNVYQNFGLGRVSEKIGPRQKFLCKVVENLTILGEGPSATNNVISSY